MNCPYCFNAVTMPLPVCRNPKCQMYDQAMPTKKSRWRARVPDRMRIRAGAYLSDREVRCDSCGLPCAAVCPTCAQDIPDIWFRYPRRTVLFLGMNGVGKSTLLATGKIRLAQQTDLLLTPLEEEDTAERFYRNYASPLTVQNASVPHTENVLPRPFLWGVTRRDRRGHACALALALYDVPGEMLLSEAEEAPVLPLLSKADGVVLVINPVALPALYAACGSPEGVAPAPDAWERAERILDTLLRRDGIGIRSKVKISVVFTHLDIWFRALKECDSAAALTSPYLEKLARRWQGGAFLTRLNEFENARLFAAGLCRDEKCRPLDGAEEPLKYLLDRMGLPAP